MAANEMETLAVSLIVRPNQRTGVLNHFGSDKRYYID
jgi:hypothetical protein